MKYADVQLKTPQERGGTGPWEAQWCSSANSLGLSCTLTPESQVGLVVEGIEACGFRHTCPVSQQLRAALPAQPCPTHASSGSALRGGKSCCVVPQGAAAGPSPVQAGASVLRGGPLLPLGSSFQG